MRQLYSPVSSAPEAPITDPVSCESFSEPVGRLKTLHHSLTESTVANGFNRSTDKRYWAKVFPAANATVLTPSVQSAIADTCSPVSWREVNLALKQAKLNRHPGPSGISLDLLTLAANDDDKPSCGLGKFIYQWIHEKINLSLPIEPDAACAELKALYKKGDKTNPHNYRPLAMIESLAKVLSLVILARLDSISQALGILPREQAGFRAREECAAQVAALVEIITRRKAAGLVTAHAYLDLKSAYDSVPHQALFAKMIWLGFPKSIVNIIERMYRSSTAVTSYKGTIIASAVTSCGLRQGCPMSPLLFNIYVSDILHGRRDTKLRYCPNILPGSDYNGIHGVDVPGLSLPSSIFPISQLRLLQIRGLSYADDIVIFAASHEQLQRDINTIAAAFAVHRLRLNPSKCEWMFTFTHKQSKAKRELMEKSSTVSFPDLNVADFAHVPPVQVLDRDDRVPVLVHGQPVLMKPFFRYLGVHVSNDGSFGEHINYVKSKTESVSCLLAHRLRSSSSPPFVRRLYLLCILYAHLSHGIEIWGPTTPKTDLAAISGSIGRATNALMMAPSRASLYGGIREWDANSASSIIIKAVTRAAEKWSSLNTWIAVLMRFPVLNAHASVLVNSSPALPAFPTSLPPPYPFSFSSSVLLPCCSLANYVTVIAANAPCSVDADLLTVAIDYNGPWLRSVIAFASHLTLSYQLVLEERSKQSLSTLAVPLPGGFPSKETALSATKALWLDSAANTNIIISRTPACNFLSLAAYGALTKFFCGSDPTVNKTNPAYRDGMEAAQGLLSVRSQDKNNALVWCSDIVETALSPLCPPPALSRLCYDYYMRRFSALPDAEARAFHWKMFDSTDSSRVITLSFRTLPEIPRLTRTLTHMAHAAAALMTIRAGCIEGFSSHNSRNLPCMHCQKHIDADSSFTLPWARHVFFDCEALSSERQLYIQPILSSLNVGQVLPVLPLSAVDGKSTVFHETLWWPCPLSFLLAGDPAVVGSKDVFFGRVTAKEDVEGWLPVRVSYRSSLGGHRLRSSVRSGGSIASSSSQLRG